MTLAIIWILVGNASKARLFQTNGRVHNMTLIKEFDHPQSREKGVDLVADRAGSGSGGAGIHGGKSPKTMPKKVEAEHFAEEIARHLNKGQGSEFGRLIIVMAPHFMGQVKSHLHDSTTKRITHTLDKDLTNLKERDLIQSLERFFI